MVESKVFSYLDARLIQVFKTTEYFGEISVQVFNDLKQLLLMGDRWIFAARTNDPYSKIYMEQICGINSNTLS